MSGRRYRTLAVAASAVALLAAGAASAGAEPPEGEANPTAGDTPTVKRGDTLALPAPASAGPVKPAAKTGGAEAEPGTEAGDEAGPVVSPAAPDDGEAPGEGDAPDPAATALGVPSLPASSCSPLGVPPSLVPIYQRAASAYGLGPQGPAILAGINEVETAFGTNLNVSSAGALGWMQFMPATWESYGVDADGDGTADPYDPEDAIFSAASYLSAAGMPADVYGAVFAYNHADWYVADVLAKAGCHAAEVGPSFGEDSSGPQIPVLRCKPAAAWRKEIPAAYLSAFEDAAGRYELGRRGVWALAAIARLESDFGRGMNQRQMRREGPLGLDRSEWRRYGVDGDGDGRIGHASPADSAATLARMIWAQGTLRAGVFAHNQAQWYVQAVLGEAEQIEGECEVDYVDWRVAPLGTGFETPGGQAVLSGNLASLPQQAPAAVKAAIEAANSISQTPYVWGGGHGSFYASGYDCSGAVSFALYGAGLLSTPLTSGQLESYGEPGPGRWITIYASPTHTYAVIAGLRWDTVGNAQGSGPRWHDAPPYPGGFVVRHPAGY